MAAPPTAAEVAQCRPQFAALDTDRDGLIDAKTVAELLRTSYLPQQVLAHVWQLANPLNRPAFDINMFAVALRSVAQAQAAAAAAAAMPPLGGGPVPARPPVAGVQPVSAAPPAAPYQRPPVEVAAGRPYMAQIGPEEGAAYGRLFQGLRPTPTGLVSVENAWPIMAKSKLPNETIARIVKLANVNADGWLDVKEFAVAMRLINDSLSGELAAVPDRLPASLLSILTPRTPAAVAPAAVPTMAAGGAPAAGPPVAALAAGGGDTGQRSRSNSTTTTTTTTSTATAAPPKPVEDEHVRILAELEQQIAAETALLAAAKQAEATQAARLAAAQAAAAEQSAQSNERAKRLNDQQARSTGLGARLAELDADLAAHRAATDDLAKAQAALADLQTQLTTPVVIT